MLACKSIIRPKPSRISWMLSEAELPTMFEIRSILFLYWQFYVGCNTVSLGSVSGEGIAIKEEALKLISDGLEGKLISVMQDLLSSNHPEQMVCLNAHTPVWFKYTKLAGTIILVLM